MVSIRPLKSLVMGFFKCGNSGQVVKTAAETGAKATSGGELKTIVEQPGLRILEQVRGDKLFLYETRVINGKPTSSIQVFAGKSSDNGLDIYRTKTIQVENGDSVFGGKKIIINKNHEETMAMTAHQEKLTKEYTHEGIYEHGEKYLKYRHWEQPKVSQYNRITYANGKTPYSEALEAKKAAEEALQAEKRALEAAALKAEQEMAAKIAAETPRVNVGKVFGKNFEELKKIQDKTLADGTRVIGYMAKDKKGCSQYIIMKDKGAYHEEYIVDIAKDMKIKYAQIGNAKLEIAMSKGLRYRQTSEIKELSYPYRKNTQIYNDGKNYVEFDEYGTPGQFKIHTSKGDVSGVREIPDVYAYTHNPYVPVSKDAGIILKEIKADAKSEYVDLLDLFKPYKS